MIQSNALFKMRVVLKNLQRWFSEMH